MAAASILVVPYHRACHQVQVLLMDAHFLSFLEPISNLAQASFFPRTICIILVELAPLVVLVPCRAIISLSISLVLEVAMVNFLILVVSASQVHPYIVPLIILEYLPILDQLRSLLRVLPQAMMLLTPSSTITHKAFQSCATSSFPLFIIFHATNALHNYLKLLRYSNCFVFPLE